MKYIILLLYEASILVTYNRFSKQCPNNWIKLCRLLNFSCPFGFVNEIIDQVILDRSIRLDLTTIL